MVTTEPPDGQGNFRDRVRAFRIVLGLARVMGATVSLYFHLATGTSSLTVWAVAVTGLLVVLSKLLFRA